MVLVRCPGCGHEGAYFIVALTEDYVTVRCPCCLCEFGIVAAQSEER